MILKDQVVSLELAKRLKELGVKQKSLFVWEYYDEQCHGIKYMPYAIVPDNYNKFKLYSAFTVAELGEMLPSTLTWEDGTYSLQQDFYADGSFNIYYYGNQYSPIDFTAETEADARALMVIYLIEKGLLNVADISKHT